MPRCESEWKREREGGREGTSQSNQLPFVPVATEHFLGRELVAETTCRDVIKRHQHTLKVFLVTEAAK